MVDMYASSSYSLPLFLYMFVLLITCGYGGLPARFQLAEEGPLKSMTSFTGSDDILEIGEKLYMKDRNLFEEIYGQVKQSLLNALKVMEQEMLAELRNNSLAAMPSEEEIADFMGLNSMVDSFKLPPPPPSAEQLAKLAALPAKGVPPKAKAPAKAKAAKAPPKAKKL